MYTIYIHKVMCYAQNKPFWDEKGIEIKTEKEERIARERESERGTNRKRDREREKVRETVQIIKKKNY